MEDVITSPLQEIQKWVGRSTRSRIHDGYARLQQPAKVSECKDGYTPFAISAEKRVAAKTLRLAQYKTAHQWAKTKADDTSVRSLPMPVAAVSTEARFRLLADEWSEKTMHISSVSDLINDTRYQQIIDLGWDALPYLLDDLQKKKRFWFPALAAITGVRPFDPGDLSNSRRMTEAWVKWGRRKGLIS